MNILSILPKNLDVQPSIIYTTTSLPEIIEVFKDDLSIGPQTVDTLFIVTRPRALIQR